MTKYNQLVFTKGKEKALDALFSGENEGVFGYLALGYQSDEQTNGFEEPADESNDVDDNGGFNEITTAENYQRIQLKPIPEATTVDGKSGQVIKKYEAELSADNVTNSLINQFAICDNAKFDEGDTTIYSAAAFKTFHKTSETSITFIVGFKA